MVARRRQDLLQLEQDLFGTKTGPAPYTPVQPPIQNPYLTGASITGGGGQVNLWDQAPVSFALPLDDVYSILESEAFWEDPTLYGSAMSGWISPENLQALAGPVGEPPPPPQYGGRRRRGGGGYAAPPETQWEDRYDVEGAPEWWMGQTPIGQYLSPTAAYASVVNSMIPFLSPEDQRSTANNLARLLPDVFGTYGDVGVDGVTIPADITTALREQFTSTRRAEGMLTSLEAMRGVSDFEEKAFGPGFTYFENLANILGDFGGVEGSPQSRQQVTQLMAALDPIMAELGGQTMAAFGPAAQAVTQPFFSAGSLVPVRQLPDGRWIFGEPEAAFF